MSSATVRASSARSRQCFGSLMGIFAIAARYSGAYFEFCAVAERRAHAVGECIRIFIPPGSRCPNFLARVSKRARPRTPTFKGALVAVTNLFVEFLKHWRLVGATPARAWETKTALNYH
jgi:hypothetical protein